MKVIWRREDQLWTVCEFCVHCKENISHNCQTSKENVYANPYYAHTDEDCSHFVLLADTKTIIKLIRHIQSPAATARVDPDIVLHLIKDQP